MESLRRATPKRKRPAPRRASHTNSTDGLTLALVVHGAPAGLRFTGDVAALDSLDVEALARLAKGGAK